MTDLLYRDDPYMKSCRATVTQVLDVGVVLDRTVFFTAGGGQPSDVGKLRADKGDYEVTGSMRNNLGENVVHLLGDTGLVVGQEVECEIDWELRHQIMRTHTAMHLLGAAVPATVTGGNFHPLRGRLDFDLPEPPQIAEIDEKLEVFVRMDAPISVSWVDQDYLASHPDLVRTMTVRPPAGAQRVSLVSIEGVDLQACGGTHVASTAEVGRAKVSKIKKKGRINRRISLIVSDE